MEFNEYQEKAWETAIYPEKKNNLQYPALGLGGEIGEVLEKVKKIIRDDNGKILEERRQALKMELGDVIWYLAAIATELGLKFDDIINSNIEKINSRKQRDQVGGSGDNR